VPIPKASDVRTKAMSCNDFRGIAISPIISKVFEYCLLHSFQSLLATNDNQFGFKKGVSCSHAIHSVRKFIDRHVVIYVLSTYRKRSTKLITMRCSLNL